MVDSKHTVRNVEQQLGAAGAVEFVDTNTLRPHPRNARTHSRKQIRQIADSIRAFGFLNPILVDDQHVVIAGHGRLAAAKVEGLSRVPVLRFDHLTPAQKRAYVVADNRIAEQAGWDRSLLAIELGELIDLFPDEGFDVSLTGFETPEIDLLLFDMGQALTEPEDKPLPIPRTATTQRGDLWRLGRHRLLCGDARDAEDVRRAMGGRIAQAVFCDPPYNLRVSDIGGRGRVRHGEFAFASGEMSPAKYRSFLNKTLGHAVAVSAPGAVHYVCMDWRHVGELVAVGDDLYGAMLNLIVWNKTNAGQGSFYRSQHELIGVFRVGEAAHRNNVELGRFGRNRSNVWTYPGVNTFAKGRTDALAAHPTVKPVALVADALRDCTARGDVVLDHFAGSGTTVLAAEKAGRTACAVEYEPGYTDVAIVRWQEITRMDAILDGDGRSFMEVAAARVGLAEPAASAQTPSRDRRTGLHADVMKDCQAGGSERRNA